MFFKLILLYCLIAITGENLGNKDARFTIQGKGQRKSTWEMGIIQESLHGSPILKEEKLTMRPAFPRARPGHPSLSNPLEYWLPLLLLDFGANIPSYPLFAFGKGGEKADKKTTTMAGGSSVVPPLHLGTGKDPRVDSWGSKEGSPTERKTLRCLK